MPNTAPGSPALSNAALSETLDLLSAAVLKMLEKLDAQDAFKLLENEAFLKGLEATFDAAVATKKQTDPARFAQYIGQEVHNVLDPALDKLATVQAGAEADRQENKRQLDKLADQEEQGLQRLRDDLAKLDRWKRRIPFIAFCGLVLVLGLGIALPRLLAGNGAGCAVIGGDWVVGNGGESAGCFFGEYF